MVGTFRNVVVCEDVRDEVGNKRSLMGVFSGDITVQQFPAIVQLAVYLEYAPDKDDSEGLSLSNFESCTTTLRWRAGMRLHP